MYPMTTPWLYIDVTWHRNDAGVVRQRSFDQIALDQFVTLSVTVMIGAARWGGYMGDFRDDWLKRKSNDNKNVSRTVIGGISSIIA